METPEPDLVTGTATTFWAQLMSFYQTYERPINIVVIVLLAIVIRFLAIKTIHKVVAQIVTGAKKSQNVDDTQAIIGSPLLAARLVQRTRTLGSVSNNLITIIVSAVAIVLAMQQLDVNLTAILASAGIVAAGLAFGAQNIVRDVLNGIFMVFEDQLGVGDIVEINEVSGRVEAVGIRITQVRDVNGTLWFIRNGEIARVGNRSHEWSRAILDLAINSDADLDNAKEIIQHAAEVVVKQPLVATRILEPPQVWGVEYVTGEQAIIRLVVKTRSGSQWDIARILREELKKELDDAGITLSPAPPANPINFSGVDGPLTTPPTRRPRRKKTL
ncbi:mechanosensitive ion channel family protein [Lysinibacter sp. HNR]|uniref:mechanosensitive ion channel family protein n=1 Tax=Lysinibacter sp. HNR TaxID=3031408 RepID=UPI002434914D|nr:mechanosensitive ion channel family protein [Lysinibacter sp. HNR]WGD36428.1 mechanosensitive ion channel family protein [Lysinibacter sp. HNR]